MQGLKADGTRPLRISLCASDALQEEWLSALRAALPLAEVACWHSAAPPADYALVWKPPQAFFDTQTALQAVFNMGAGVDALLALRMPADLQLIRLDDAGMAVQMAEYVCHFLLRHFRGFDGYAADMQQRHWVSRAPQDRADFPVGILGLGALGARVAQAVQAFEFPVNSWSRTPKALPQVRSFVGTAQLGDFLAASRVLVCLLPLTAQTQGILNAATLSQLPKGAYLINVARGAHLVEADLCRLLDQGHLVGAALDVTQTEPLPAAHAFWRYPQISLTPHIAACTLPAQSIAQIVGKIAALEAGQAVQGVVQRAQGY